MKKTPFVTVNLRKSVYAAHAAVFALSVCICCIASRSVRPISIGKTLTNAIISSDSCAAIQAEASAPTLFLREKKNNPENKNTKPTAKSVSDSETSASVTAVQTSVPTAPIHTRTAAASSGEVQVSNNAGASFDAAALSSSAPQFLKGGCSVLIMHTHTSESYTPSEKYSYTPSDTDRTLDKNYNMVRVGNEIEDVLKKSGIKVYHDTTVNDYPSYNGSYSRSGRNVQNYLKNDPSIKIVLDVHRDAIESSDGGKIKHVCTVDGQNAACVMFVVGTDLSGLSHSGWKTNMSFAMCLQKYINRKYPSLCRPINLRKQRFNQQLAPGALIVEVGTNGNTLDESLLGAKYFAESLAGFLRENQP